MTTTEQFLKQKWWADTDFLPGCTLTEDPDQPGIWMFRGLVANTRRLRRYGRSVKFVTIGTGPGEYIDLVAKGDTWEGNNTIVMGVGQMKVADGARFLEVVKMWPTWFAS